MNCFDIHIMDHLTTDTVITTDSNVFTLTERRLEEMSERILENSLKRIRKTSSETSCADDTIVDLIKSMTAELKEVVHRVESQVNGIITHQTTQEKKLTDIESKIEKQINDTAKLREETKKDISDIKKSIDKESKSTKQKFLDIDKQMKDMKEICKKIEIEEKRLKRKSIEIEANSRRSNLLFFGIKENKDENCAALLKTFFETQLGITSPVVIQRAHRFGKTIGKNVIGKSTNRPRPIIALFLDFQQREAVRIAAHKKLLPPTPYGVAEDQPIEIRKARQSVAPLVKELKNKNKKVTILYPCRVLCDGEIVKVIDIADFSG